MKNSIDLDRALQRAHLPEVLFEADVEEALDLAPDQAAAGLREGLFGPAFLVGGRPAVLRSDFFETVRLRAAQTDPVSRDLFPEPQRLRPVGSDDADGGQS